MAVIPNTRGNPQASDIAVQSALPLTGTASREDLQSVLTSHDSDIAKLYEDRNIVLTDGGLVTFTGTAVQFTQNLLLEVNSKIAGGSPVVINLGSSTWSFSANGRMAYAVIDRVAGTATVTTDSATLPTVASPNKEVFLLAKRSDSADGLQRVYFRNGSAFDVGQTARIGSAGSGSGSGNEILETVKNAFVDSLFDLAKANVFSTDTTTNVDGSSTGSYSLVTKTFNLPTIGNTLVTANLLDSVEFANLDALAELELMVFWTQGSIDPSATYQISRNGGNEYQTVSMTRIGSTEAFRGYKVFADESVNQTLTSVVGGAASDALNGTTQQQLGQSFTLAAKTLLKSLTLNVASISGTPSGNLYVSIVNNNAGVPSLVASDVLCESNAISAAGIGTGTLTVNIPDIYLLAGTYHIVIRSDAAYKTAGNFISFGRNAASSGANKYNGTSYSSSTGGYINSTVGITLDLRLKITSATTSVKLDAFAVFYDKSVAKPANSVLPREVVTFSGSANTSTFTLTRFVPNPELLKVYDVTSGQVYSYGAFSLNGMQVVFSAGQFNAPGQTLTLVFDQTTGGAFDNSDLNALSLATNHLGDPTNTVDRSIAGRGIYLRRPDGTLREICIDNNDNITIYSV